MRMMEYREFVGVFQRRVQEKMGNDIRIETVKVSKNNQADREELTCKSRESNMNPGIMLEEFYGIFQKAGMEECVEKAVEIFGCRERVSNRKLFGIWESAGCRVMPELVNEKWNHEGLEKIPHTLFLDLAVIFRFRIRESESMDVVITVTESIMKYWGISQEELCAAAFRNLRKEPYKIERLSDVLSELLGMEGMEMPEMEEEEKKLPMFVLTNLKKVKGSSGMLRTGLLQEFAEKKNSSFFILPSSVHELLLIPDDGRISAGELRVMVHDINREIVRKDEWLSDEVYYFRRSTGAVEVIKK